MDIANSFRDNLMVEDHYRMILDGLQVTLLITLFAALLGTLLRVLAATLVCSASLFTAFGYCRFI